MTALEWQMAVDYSLDEVLAMAEQIERNGARFYRLAAGLGTDLAVRAVLESLAAWEEGHEGIFAKMRRDLTPEELSLPAFDPDGVGETYLRAVADQQVFRPGKEPEQLLSGNEAPEDVIRIALNFERDAILFFLGMRDVVPDRLGKHHIQDLIDEEVRHVAYLGEELRRLAQA